MYINKLDTLGVNQEVKLYRVKCENEIIKEKEYMDISFMFTDSKIYIRNFNGVLYKDKLDYNDALDFVRKQIGLNCYHHSHYGNFTAAYIDNDIIFLDNEKETINNINIIENKKVEITIKNEKPRYIEIEFPKTPIKDEIICDTICPYGCRCANGKILYPGKKNNIEVNFIDFCTRALPEKAYPVEGTIEKNYPELLKGLEI